jgi:uncharacterized repeat protein (TIGR03803 family)
MRVAGASAVLTLATVLVMIASTQSAHAQTFTTLHTFDSTDGSFPEAGLVQARDGNLYGTTSRDGTSGGGTVFRITPGGTLTTLYNFCSDCKGGGYGSYAGLIQASDGNFYGTASFGGNLTCDGGCGTIFKMTQGGTLTTLYNFCPQTGCADGDLPSAVLQASDGDLYGTADLGGIDNKGTVFKITLSGTLTTLHSFTGTDGANPNAGLVQATDGNFYGAASDGGTNGNGTVFKITPSGTFTTVYTFDGTEDGAFPGALIQASNGNLYGTTYSAGSGFNGTVFEINSAGTLTTLHSFAGPDGSSPYSGLVQATNGTLYGTTSFGGANSEGTIFGITASGVLTVLHSFCSQSSCADGEWPTASLIQDTDGSLYGTASTGGVDLSGTVFSLSVGLHPFVKTQSSSGKVGAKVIILGNKLTGASKVTFNGTAATFSVVSKSEIITTVPTGATSGTIEVTTSSGTLKSNTKFRVTP